MEIEAKFRVEAADTFDQLRSLSQLGPFRLEVASEPEIQQNMYLDTVDQHLREQRHGLRVRELHDRRIATLKGRASFHDGVYERDEWEVEVDGDTPASWPESEVRARVLELIGDTPLQPTVTVRTTRHHIYAYRDDARVAEISLDEGVIQASGGEEPFRELEIELLDGASREDFDTLVHLLRESYPLLPEEHSKLERGLALFDRAAQANSTDDQVVIPEAPAAAQASSADDQATIPEAPTVVARPINRRVIAHALFTGAAAAHKLAQREWKLLDTAIAFYDIAHARGADNPARDGRNMVLSAPLADLDEDQQCVIASVVAFQREKLKRTQELAYLRLDSEHQQVALRLASILSFANAAIEADAPVVARGDKHETAILVGGPRADEAAALLSARESRWRQAIGPVRIRAAEAGELVDVLTTDGPSKALLEPHKLPIVAVPASGDEPIAEGARRMLRRFFEKMLAREEDVREGEDPEDIHQMRVATRRIRASLQVVETLFEPKLIRKFRRHLRAVAAALGYVRDADVLLAHVRSYREQQPEGERDKLDALIAQVEEERTKARAELLKDLEAKRYNRFKKAFARFLTTPGAGVAAAPEHGAALRVRDRAGSLIWRRYEDVRAFETVFGGANDETLHEMRIAGKRLRYTLEFFADALGPHLDACLDPLMELQESLGSLQDSVVARERISRLAVGNDAAAHAYLSARDAERAQLRDELPHRWERVTHTPYRTTLLEAIGAM